MRCLGKIHLQRKLFTCIVRSYSIEKPKTSVKKYALDHFDQFYGLTFKNWASIRLGLLCPHSYCAVINSFGKTEEISDSLQSLGAFKINELYYEEHLRKEECDLQVKNEQEEESSQTDGHDDDDAVDTEDFRPTSFSQESIDSFVPCTEVLQREVQDIHDQLEIYTPPPDFKVKVEEQKRLQFPSYLEVYMFPRGKFKEFPPPSKDATGLFNYYLMNGASILPVLALNLQDKDDVGDLCASPGGKSLSIAFCLKFGKLVCNDVSVVRLNKLKKVMTSYLPHAKDWNKKVLVSKIDVRSWSQFEAFDKILLDVPCTNDRMSVTKESNNIFKQGRFQERMSLPRSQTQMLCAGLKSLKCGGSLVYSTCSLSPLQNDGVVHQALAELEYETKFEFKVMDLTTAFEPFKNLFQFSENCRYGQLIVPFLPMNYGPMYISKISRIA